MSPSTSPYASLQGKATRAQHGGVERRHARYLPAAITLALLPLGACNLAPVYTGGSSGVAQTALAGIAVDPIPDQVGYLVGDRVRQRLGPAPGIGAPRRLTVRLDDRIDGFGVRGDNSIIRERRTLRARFTLIDSSGRVLLDETTAADSGIDVTRSEYATVAAEQTALERLSERIADQIVARLAVAARQGFPNARQPAPPGVPADRSPRSTTLGTPVDPQSVPSGGLENPAGEPVEPQEPAPSGFIPGTPTQPSGLPTPDSPR